MSVEIKGLSNLIKKLDNVSNLDTTAIISEVANDMENALRKEASVFSKNAYQYIGKSEVKKYGIGSYVKIGLKNDFSPFELWKSLYFQNYGFNDYGLNLNGQIYVSTHILWFDSAIKRAEKEVKSKIKARLKEELAKVV